MTDTGRVHQQSRKLEQSLEVLRTDFEKCEGKPFVNFFCPMLLTDDDVPLCMGHVVNEIIPNSSRQCVVQREDVDNWFGSLVEADFSAHAQSRSKTLDEILTEQAMRKKVGTAFVIKGEPIPHYEDRGRNAQGHTPITLHLGKGRNLNLVLKKKPEEIDALEEYGFELKIGKDNRLAAFVSLIKAGYLTLFKLLGYSYGLSAAGIEIGHNLLGKFYTNNCHKKSREALEDAVDFFRPYINMMRSIEKFSGQIPRGTVEDGRAQACVNSDGNFFAVIVWIRANDHFYALLLPAFNEPEGAAAYFNFMTNDNQSLRAQSCQFDEGIVNISQQVQEVVWPKGDITFSFD